MELYLTRDDTDEGDVWLWEVPKFTLRPKMRARTYLGEFLHGIDLAEPPFPLRRGQRMRVKIVPDPE